MRRPLLLIGLVAAVLIGSAVLYFNYTQGAVSVLQGGGTTGTVRVAPRTALVFDMASFEAKRDAAVSVRPVGTAPFILTLGASEFDGGEFCRQGGPGGKAKVTVDMKRGERITIIGTMGPAPAGSYEVPALELTYRAGLVSHRRVVTYPFPLRVEVVEGTTPGKCESVAR